MKIIEKRSLEALLIFDLIDDFQQDLSGKGLSSLKGKTRFFAIGEINGRSLTPFTSPVEMIMVQNSAGYNLFFGRVALENGLYRNRYLQEKKHRIKIVNPLYQQTEIDITIPTSTQAIQLNLQPGYLYPFPRTSNFSPTLLRGVVQDKAGKGIANTQVAVGSLTYRTDESGQWVIVFPESEKSGRKTVQITFPDKSKKSAKVTITQGESVTMERILSDQ